MNSTLHERDRGDYDPESSHLYHVKEGYRHHVFDQQLQLFQVVSEDEAKEDTVTDDEEHEDHMVSETEASDEQRRRTHENEGRGPSLIIVVATTVTPWR